MSKAGSRNAARHKGMRVSSQHSQTGQKDRDSSRPSGRLETTTFKMIPDLLFKIKQKKNSVCAPRHNVPNDVFIKSM